MSNNRAPRLFKWLIIVVILAGAGTVGYRMWKKSESTAPQYRTAPVTRGALTQSVTASGQLNPVVTVQVGSQVSGIIDKLFVDFNSSVTNGQVIAQLDPATFQANVHQAEGDLANAQSAEELAKLNADRAKSLFDQKLIAKADYDKAVADLHQADASVKIKTAALEKARVDLARTTIYSPIDGVVISREVDVGQTVAASLNAPVLFKIANDLTKMQIDAMVSEADIGGVEEGEDVTFSVDAFPTRTFHGKVQQVRNSPVMTQNVVTYDTVVAVHNEDLKLKPGMTANVTIVVAHKEDVLKLPNAALRFRLPETATAESASTNAPSVAQTNAVAGGEGRGGRLGGGFGQRGGAGGGGPGAWRGGAGRPERSPVKTIYVAEKTATGGIQPKAVQIKTGISDNVSTEVLEGLQEGAEVIVGINTPEGETGNRPASNPFGGGFRRF